MVSLLFLLTNITSTALPTTVAFAFSRPSIAITMDTITFFFTLFTVGAFRTHCNMKYMYIRSDKKIVN